MSAIFVCGILGRSGTNFLRDLLVLHPDCAAPRDVPEDYLLHHADLLLQYTDAATMRWSDDLASAALLQRLGGAVLEELSSRAAGARVVTKTPSVGNLRLFGRLFPGAHLVVVVRDGRSVAESYVRSFDANYEGVMRRWAHAAREIRETQAIAVAREHPILVVRYESLCADPEAALLPLLGALELDIGVYDFDAARSLPIRGSSEAARSEVGLHWSPIERPEDFDPIERWSSWDQRRHDRFNWIAGAEMVQLGYGLVERPGGLRRKIENRVLDGGWAAARRLHLLPAARRVLGRLRLQGHL